MGTDSMLSLAQQTLPANVALLTALFLAAAVAGVRIARITHIPRVVGYLLLGLGLRLVLQRITGQTDADGFPLGNALPVVQIIKSLALSLIMFAIGTAFDAAHLRAIKGHVWKLTLCEVLAVSLLVFVATWITGQGHSPVQATFLAIAAVATAPAATLLVLRQYGAKGPMTDHILAMTGMNNLIAIVAFYVAFLVFAEIGPDAGGIHAEHMDHGLAMGITAATVGSAIIGFVTGLALSLAHVKLTRFESLLLLFAVMFAVSVGAKTFGLNGLIICMFMGMAFVNFSIQPRQLLAELEPISAPIFALFFVLAGFSLELARLWQVGAVGIAFLLARSVGKIGGAHLGVRWIGPRHRVPAELGTAMLCQAGVAIGLGKYLIEHWGSQVDGTFQTDPGATAVNTVILASVAFFELTGPLATKRAVVRAGEVKTVALLARPGGSFREMTTIISRLRRAIRPRKETPATQPPEELITRHVMRTNIESLPDTAKMEEVLRFVEHSRLNHFFVVDSEGHFVGTIDFPDLRNLMFNPVMARMLTAYDMANTAPPVAVASQPLEEVLDLFHRHNVGSLPVIENAESRRLLGVIEQRDVLKAMHVRNTGHIDDTEH